MQRGVRRDGIDFRFCGAQHVDWRKARRLVVFEGCVLDALPLGRPLEGETVASDCGHFARPGPARPADRTRLT